MNLFTIRKQYNAMMLEQHDKMVVRFDAAVAAIDLIDAEREALGDYTHRRDERRELVQERDSLLKMMSDISFGLKPFDPATPEIVALMQDHHPEWLEVEIPAGCIRRPGVVVAEEPAIVEADAVVVEAGPACCGKWVVFDPRDVATASCDCAHPANDVAAIDAFLDDYNALFGMRVAA